MILDNLEAAYDAALIYLDRCGNSDFRLSDAYSMLAEISFRRGDLAACNEYAQLGAVHAQRSYANTRRWVLEFWAWQALCARMDGEEDKGQVKYRLATLQAERIKTRPFAAYYDAMCAYHEAGDEFDLSLNLRDQQLVEAVSSRSPHFEAECRLRRCLLFKKMEQPLDVELAAAHECAKRLILPEKYLDKLDKLLNAL
jgi:hypothetical protein